MSHRWRLLAVLCVPSALAFGCGGQAPQSFNASKPAGEAAPTAPPAKDAEPAKRGEELIARKIIYSATIEVIVKDLETARKEVERIVEEQQGYIAKSESLSRKFQATFLG